jgi:hypothetical protein
VQSNLISVFFSPTVWCIVAEVALISIETSRLPFSVLKSGARQDPLTSSGILQDAVLLRVCVRKIKASYTDLK